MTFSLRKINFAAETGVFRDIYVKTVTTDALTLCIIRSSATMSLPVQDTRVLVFRDVRFQIYAPSQCCEMTENTNAVYIS